MAPEDEVGVRGDLHVPAFDEEGAGGARPEGEPDPGVPPELVLRVLDLAGLPRRGELDPVIAAAADQVRLENDELGTDHEVGGPPADQDVPALAGDRLLVHPRIERLEP